MVDAAVIMAAAHLAVLVARVELMARWAATQPTAAVAAVVVAPHHSALTMVAMAARGRSGRPTLAPTTDNLRGLEAVAGQQAAAALSVRLARPEPVGSMVAAVQVAPTTTQQARQVVLEALG
jgi:hypothetical protein